MLWCFRLRHVCPFGKGIICYSYDEGKTWTKPAVVIDTPLDDRDCGIVAYGIKIIASKDEGQSWENLGFLYINGVSADLGYPCSVQLNDGNILTVFYAHNTKGAPAEIMQIIWNLE